MSMMIPPTMPAMPYGAMPQFGGSYGMPVSTMGPVAVAPAKSVNPFKTNYPKHNGEPGSWNSNREVMRPGNDRLDRLVAICVEKLDFGLAQITALTEDCATMQSDLAASHTGGDKDLRTQLVKANKEIHRLRTILAATPGSVDDEPEDEVEEEGEEEEYAGEDKEVEEGPVF